MTTVNGPGPAVRGFNDLNLSTEMLAVLQELGYSQPTPIQSKSIPLLLAGRDVVGQAQTGSGKTYTMVQKLNFSRETIISSIVKIRVFYQK